MKNIEKVIIPMIVIVLITMLGIYYISKEYEKQQAQKRAEALNEQNASDEEIVSAEELVYENTAMLVGKDEEDHKLKFISVDNDKIYELDYTDKTPVLGRHGNYITFNEIPLGEIFDVSYSIHNRELLKLQISSEAWTFTDVTRFDIDPDSGRMDIAGSTYKLPKTAVVSYKDELASFIDVTNVDTLIVKGWGRKVCSVIVDKGHGYVRLLNDSYFEGGWIEIGQEIIKPVVEDMLIPVPEGNYRVRLTNRGYAAEEDITVERDRETSVDLSKVDIKEVAIGHVEFNITPDYAQLYIDGTVTDFDERIPLEFGVHKIHIELAGYNSVDTNIRVSDEFANVDIVLEKELLGKDNSTTSTTSTKKTTTSKTTTAKTTGTTAVTSATASTFSPVPSLTDLTSSSTTSKNEDIISDYKKMYIESPVSAEVYVDDIYVGISPLSFLKPSKGNHVIILRRDGYITRSYTINVLDDGKDLTLSFSDLVPEKKEEEKKPKEEDTLETEDEEEETPEDAKEAPPEEDGDTFSEENG